MFFFPGEVCMEQEWQYFRQDPFTPQSAAGSKQIQARSTRRSCAQLSVFPSFPSIELQSCKLYLFLKRPRCYLKTYHLRNCGFKEQPAKPAFPQMTPCFSAACAQFHPQEPHFQQVWLLWIRSPVAPGPHAQAPTKARNLGDTFPVPQSPFNAGEH